MRSKGIRLLGVMTVLVTGLVILRTGIVMAGEHWSGFGAQQQLIKAREIRPATLFYTENPLALNAEKVVRIKVGRTSAGQSGIELQN